MVDLGETWQNGTLFRRQVGQLDFALEFISLQLKEIGNRGGINCDAVIPH
jgi:hypothetical protein